MKQILLFLLAILLFHPGVAAFSQQGGYYPKGGPDSGVEDVSMIQLIANPQVYDNKRVRITGFLHLEFEGDAIYLHREDFSYALKRANEGCQQLLRHLHGAISGRNAWPYGSE